MTAVTHPDNTVTYRAYLPTGAVQKIWGAGTYPVEYEYDSQGRRKTLKTWQLFDQNAGNGTSGLATTTWTYDSQRGWLNSKAYQGAGGPSYLYWPSGRLKKRTWARGVYTNYAYDNAGVINSITYSDSTPSVSYTYDRMGRAIGVVDGVGTRVLTYGDTTLNSETFSAGTFTPYDIEHTYDALLRRNRLALNINGDPQGQTDLAFEPNSSRLLSVQKDTGPTATYQYETGSDTVHSLTYRASAAGTVVATSVRQHDNLGRLTSLNWTQGSTTTDYFGYEYNDVSQRTRVNLLDGTSWLYSYDTLGQLSSGERRFGNNTTVPGEKFEYTFDSIGNRTSTRVYGEGGTVRQATYYPTLLNQYTGRTVPGAADIIGYSSTSSVVVSSDGTNYTPSWYSGLFEKTLTWDNTSSARFEEVDISAGGTLTEKRYVFIPKTSEFTSYDTDGNQITDGHWAYTWDAENRLATMTTNSGLPSALPQERLEFVYDYLSRRCIKRRYIPGGMDLVAMEPGAKVSDTSSASTAKVEQPTPPPQLSPNDAIVIPPGWTIQNITKYVWDTSGWNMIAETQADDTMTRTYAWGLDLSGSEQGAGGIGGMVFTCDGWESWQFPVYDGNGNVVAISTDGAIHQAQYEHGPFGESLYARDNLSTTNPFRFSTKYTDAESGGVYFGRRYYNSGFGRWLSRDPQLENGGTNLYSFVHNDSPNSTDAIGLERIILAIDGFGAASVSTAVVAELWEPLVEKFGDNDWSWHYYYHTQGLKPFNDFINKVKEPIEDKTLAGPCTYNTLVIIGWSNGADNAFENAKQFEHEGVIVDYVLTVDPIQEGPLAFFDPGYVKPAHAGVFKNYYQRTDTVTVLRGHSVKNASPNKEEKEADFDPSNIYAGAAAGFTAAEIARAAHHHVWLSEHNDVMGAVEAIETEVKPQRGAWSWK